LSKECSVARHLLSFGETGSAVRYGVDANMFSSQRLTMAHLLEHLHSGVDELTALEDVGTHEGVDADATAFKELLRERKRFVPTGARNAFNLWRSARASKRKQTTAEVENQDSVTKAWNEWKTSGDSQYDELAAKDKSRAFREMQGMLRLFHSQNLPPPWERAKEIENE